MNKKLTLLVGPPGSGKSTLAKEYVDQGFTYINQDLQGKEHLHLFDLAILSGDNVVVDRMNFSKIQRERYLSLAKEHGYQTKVIVLHQPYKVCLERCLARQDHLTIKDEKSARAALQTFFTKYERVEDSEADEVVRKYPEGVKDRVIWSDIDGTVALVDHRRHFVRGEGKKNWKGFFDAMVDDQPNIPVIETLDKLGSTYPIVYCSGRPDSYRKQTREWLDKYCPSGELYMRNRQDSRKDNIVKEIILDFEILTRYSVFMCLDDRDQVVKMLRKRGLTVFQVAEGDF